MTITLLYSIFQLCTLTVQCTYQSDKKVCIFAIVRESRIKFSKKILILLTYCYFNTSMNMQANAMMIF